MLDSDSAITGRTHVNQPLGSAAYSSSEGLREDMLCEVRKIESEVLVSEVGLPGHRLGESGQGSTRARAGRRSYGTRPRPSGKVLRAVLYFSLDAFPIPLDLFIHCSGSEKKGRQGRETRPHQHRHRDRGDAHTGV